MSLDDARTRYQNGDLAGALAGLDETLGRNPDDADALNLRGAVRLDLGDAEGARADFDAAVRLAPTSHLPFYNRGIVRLRTGDEAGALEDFERATAIAPDYEPARQAAAELRLRRAIADGYARYDAGDFNGALAAAADSGSADACFLRGMVRIRLQQYREAIADFDEFLRQRPDSAEARLNRGIAREGAGDLDAALQDYDAASSIDAGRAAAEKLRARLTTARFDSALAHHDANRFDEALVDADRYLKDRPADPNGWVLRGAIHLGAGRPSESVADFDEALRLDPSNARALYNRGLARKTLLDPKRALEDWDRAAAIDPAYDRPRSAAAELRQALDADRPDWMGVGVAALLMVLAIGVALGVVVGGMFGGMKLADMGYEVVGIGIMILSALVGFVLVPLAIRFKLMFGAKLFEAIFAIRTGRGVVGLLMVIGGIWVAVKFLGAVSWEMARLKEIVGNLALILALFGVGVALIASRPKH